MRNHWRDLETLDAEARAALWRERAAAERGRGAAAGAGRAARRGGPVLAVGRSASGGCRVGSNACRACGVSPVPPARGFTRAVHAYVRAPARVGRGRHSRRSQRPSQPTQRISWELRVASEGPGAGLTGADAGREGFRSSGSPGW
ncbi:hypothetical protein GCM10010376_86310 [Streptomyces violaceusniger]